MPVRIVLVVVGIVVLIAVVAIAGTFISYFIVAMAMQNPPKSPFTITCTQLAPPRGKDVRVRFDVANAARKDVTWMNFAMFAAGTEGKNLSDWGYALKTRVPAGASASKVVAIPLDEDYRHLRFSSVKCNLINVVFADGSQQDYTSNNDVFP